MDNLIIKLYNSPKTVFSYNDIALFWDETNTNNLKAKISYYVKQKVLTRLSRGIFVKDKNYNVKELAVAIYTPSYISFETVLREAGVIFQHYDSVFVVSKWPKIVKIGKHTFCFRKLKDIILYNPKGVISQNNYSIATPERALLDMIYLFPNYYFDNLEIINWEVCFDLAEIYNNKQLIKRLRKYHKNYVK